MARTHLKWVGIAAVVGLAATAVADPVDTANPNAPTSTLAPGQGRRVVVDTPVSAFTGAVTPQAPTISPFIYLNRCTGGCTVTGGGTNDARTQQSSIPTPGTHTIGEFTNMFNQTGTMGVGTCLGDGTTVCTTDADCAAMTPTTCDTADLEWSQVVQCMKEVYSPFAVTLSDTIPAGGVSYTESIIAGQPTDIGQTSDVLGIAPLAGDCSAQDNVISFAFANHHGNMDRVDNICWTAAQETAHAFGLDHEYQFADQTSACDDPMTYRTDCGGEKFFRDKAASCGEYAVRVCKCGGSQNSDLKILSVFGPGTSLIPAPDTSIVFPTGGTVSTGFAVQASSGSKRGVAVVELWLNGYKWASHAGAAFGPEGQPVPSSYALVAPTAVPDGVIDIVVKAYDDLNIEGDSPVVTVTKGAPCTSAATCLTGQKCDSGKCYWDPPTGQLGDACTYGQFCATGICEGTSSSTICTQDCVVGAADACPAGYDCVMTTDSTGVCFTSSAGGGCCSVEGSSSAGWVHGGLSALVLGILIRRRKRN